MTPHVDPSRFEAASRDERAAMTAHLRSCGSCRAALAAQDPTAIFALLALEPVPERVLEQVSRGVFAAAGSVSDAPATFLADRGFPRAAALAAAMCLAALLGTMSFRNLPPDGRAPSPGIAASSPAPTGARPPRAGVAVLATPGTPQVVDLTVGETQIVMIFDARMAL